MMDNLPGHGIARYLGVSVMVFLEEISIWIGELSEADGSPQCEWASFNELRAWIEQNGRLNSLSAWLLDLDNNLLLPLGIWFSGFGTQTAVCTIQLPDSQAFELYLMLSWSSFADGR